LVRRDAEFQKSTQDDDLLSRTGSVDDSISVTSSVTSSVANKMQNVRNGKKAKAAAKKAVRAANESTDSISRGFDKVQINA
jgi:hypothetical protein